MAAKFKEKLATGKQAELYIAFFASLSALFGLGIILTHFSSDDYLCYYSQIEESNSVIAASYRWVLGMAYRVLNAVGINVVAYRILFGVLLLMGLALCCTAIYLEMVELCPAMENGKKKTVLFLATLLFWGNVFETEWMWFNLAYIQWLLSALGATFGAIACVKYKQSLRGFLLSAMFLFIMMGSYQGGAAQYVYLILVFSFLQSRGKLTGKTVCAWLYAAAALAVATIADLALVMVGIKSGAFIANSRIGAAEGILAKLPAFCQTILAAQKNIWVYGLGIAPKYLLPAFLALLLGCLTYTLLKNKSSVGTYLFAIILLLSGMIVVYLIQLVAADIWLALRVCVPLLCVYPCMLWMITFLNQEDSKVITATGFAACALLICSILITNYQAINLSYATVADKLYFNRVKYKISEYEKDSGVEVRNVGFCNDQNTMWRENIQKYVPYSELGTRAVTTAWSDIYALNYLTDSNYVKTEVPDRVKALFSAQDWTCEDLSEQMIFDEDTVYICVY